VLTSGESLSVERFQAPREGLEHPPRNTGNTQKQLPGSAPSGAFSADLLSVIDAWPYLPDDVRRAVLALISTIGS
jgi:hypothetical protein